MEEFSNCIFWFAHAELEIPLLIVETRYEHDLEISSIIIEMLSSVFSDAVTIDILEDETFLEMKINVF